MKLINRLLVLGLALILSACATSFKVATDYDEKFDFNNKQTYALIYPKDIQTTRNDLIKNRIEKALRNELKQKGFSETDKNQASIWISYFTTTEKQQDIRTYQNYNHFYGYARCYRCVYPAPVMTTDVHVVNYTEGTLIIDVINPENNQLKWRGTTKSRITTSQADSLTVDERTEKVNAAVGAIMLEYPPKKAQ